MNVVHATPPTICPDCLAVCHELAKSAQGALMKRCDHTGNGITLAVGFTAAGQILRFDLKGPCTEHEAEYLAMAYVRAMQLPLAAAPTSMQ